VYVVVIEVEVLIYVTNSEHVYQKYHLDQGRGSQPVVRVSLVVRGERSQVVRKIFFIHQKY
jgi:hypothetical protein